VVTHLTTNPPVRCLNRAERTGSLVFNVLWSYVQIKVQISFYIRNFQIPLITWALGNPTKKLPWSLLDV
jgi:hypothetical protein